MGTVCFGLSKLPKNVENKVNSLGIVVQLLKDLIELDNFAQGKIVVKLLFVIPREILTKFPVQQFWSPRCLKHCCGTAIYI